MPAKLLGPFQQFRALFHHGLVQTLADFIEFHGVKKHSVHSNQIDYKNISDPICIQGRIVYGYLF